MEVSHNREHGEHLLGRSRILPPVLPTKNDLRYLLPGTEAIINAATSKALLSEACVNAAAKVHLQIGTSLPGVFIDREVHRSREGQRNTT